MVENLIITSEINTNIELACGISTITNLISEIIYPFLSFISKINLEIPLISEINLEEI